MAGTVFWKVGNGDVIGRNPKRNNVILGYATPILKVSA